MRDGGVGWSLWGPCWGVFRAAGVTGFAWWWACGNWGQGGLVNERDIPEEESKDFVGTGKESKASQKAPGLVQVGAVHRREQGGGKKCQHFLLEIE